MPWSNAWKTASLHRAETAAEETWCHTRLPVGFKKRCCAASASLGPVNYLAEAQPKSASGPFAASFKGLGCSLWAEAHSALSFATDVGRLPPPSMGDFDET